MNSTTVALSDEQLRAVEHLLRFSKPVQTLGGLAGTGKSYCVRALKDALPRFAVCAYTGKAVDVLRRRGIEASTIHSLAYRRVVVEVGGKQVERYDLKDRLGLYGEDDEPGGLIVDEASMVSADLFRDLESFGMPMIFVGDHGQLEPIEDKRTPFNLMKHPDVTLETIHRNAGEIARFAEFLRKGGEPRDWHVVSLESIADGKVRFTKTPSAEYGNVDQMVCAFNSKRTSLNLAERRRRGFPDGEPVVGDRVICLHNSRDHDVFNGMQGVIESLGKELLDGRWWDVLSFRGDDGTARRVPYAPEQFGREAKIDWQEHRGRVPFDWAYAVTCHKMQGSEAERVMVFDECARTWDRKRWRYTAASRARSELIWV